MSLWRRHTDAGPASRHRRRHRPWGGRRRGRRQRRLRRGTRPHATAIRTSPASSRSRRSAAGRPPRVFLRPGTPPRALSAPGVSVVGADPWKLSGRQRTSPASAIVAGVAALIRSRRSWLSPVQVELAITSFASRRPAGSGHSPDAAFWEASAPAALTAAARLAATAPQDWGLAAGAHFGPVPGPIQVVADEALDLRLRGGRCRPGLCPGAALLTWLIVRVRRLRSSRPSA